MKLTCCKIKKKKEIFSIFLFKSLNLGVQVVALRLQLYSLNRNHNRFRRLSLLSKHNRSTRASKRLTTN